MPLRDVSRQTAGGNFAIEPEGDFAGRSLSRHSSGQPRKNCTPRLLTSVWPEKRVGPEP